MRSLQLDKPSELPTRLAVFCDKLLEAGWLFALVVAPLYFDVYSNRVFEPDKISLVRSLALVMIVAWVLKQIEVGSLRGTPAEILRRLPRENPLVLPTAAVVIVYLVSTLLSVAPTVSFWGSYTRLQGTYTTFSYIAIFMIAASSLRTRVQFDRMVNTAIVVSFPIAFYGIVQHFQLDPLPWGGDVTQRVASNMGNSIFVAAYLIMVVPLTLARWIETIARVTHGAGEWRRVLTVAVAVVILAGLSVLWLLDFGVGSAAVISLLFAAMLIALWMRGSWRDHLLGVVYTAVLAAQLVAVFFTQSRGPWLGLAGGLFAFTVLYALARGARRVMFGAIGLGAIAAVLLGILNLPSSPLDPLKSVPYVGRLGQLLETGSGTGKVRELIWQGAIELISPHAPLWSPTTGDDPLNAVRLLVGYGPEAMYVAFNQFYPPELAHYELRNASPDRAHNETFDALVMTGLLGFGAYILLFISVFYFGLKWLGLIRSPGQRNAFVLFWLAGGLVAALGFGLTLGWNFVGVALPAGMIAGLFLFLIVTVLRPTAHPEDATDALRQAEVSTHRALWLSALLAALIGHFVEIHFGIAIVSTRTYFWFYAALLVILGLNRLAETAPAPASAVPAARVTEEAPPEKGKAARRRQRRRAVENERAAARPGIAGETLPLGPVLAWTALATLILVTLAFSFLNNQAGRLNALDAVVRALAYKGDDPSYGILALFVLTGLIAGIVGLGEELRAVRLTKGAIGIAIALFAILSFTALLWYVLFQMRWLTQPGDLTEAFIAVLGLYYVSLFLLLTAFALALSLDQLPRGAVLLRGAANAVVAPVSVFVLAALIYFTNFTGVSADILYKSGTSYEAAGAWDQSILIYQRTRVLQPAQDFYALFLGRAYLEGGRSVDDPVQRTQLLAKSEEALLAARSLNPLNTDHSANLARLHRIWASLVDDPAQKAQHYQESSKQYEAATRLSPNTAYLYNEWSQTYTQSGAWDKALEKLERSLEIDAQFAQTYFYLGEYYRTRPTPDYSLAADYYLKTIALDPAALAEPDRTPAPGPMSVLARPEIAPRAFEAYRTVSQASPSVVAHFALAELFKQSGQLDRTRQELEQAVKIAPNDYLVRLVLVNFFSETGQIDAAVNAMRPLMSLLASGRTPDYKRFEDFYAQLQNLQKALQAAKNAPGDINAQRSVAALWRARGQAQFALPAYQTVVRLAPNDYDALKNVALLTLQLGRLDDAQGPLTAAAALAPENEKSMWQSLQVALNAQKSRQLDEALKQARAAMALAAEGDRPIVQEYVTLLQNQGAK